MGYSKNQVQTIPQLRVKVSPSGQEKYPLDITVFRDERKSYYNVYMLVESKQPNRKDGRKQLDIYLNLVPLVEKGDVLRAMTVTVEAIKLLSSIIYQGNISQNVVRTRILEEWQNKVPAEYIVALLNSKFGQTQIQGLLTSTNQKYLNQIAIAQIKIPLLDNLKVIATIYRQAYQLEMRAFSKIEQAKQLLEKVLNINHKEINEDKYFPSTSLI